MRKINVIATAFILIVIIAAIIVTIILIMKIAPLIKLIFCLISGFAKEMGQ